MLGKVAKGASPQQTPSQCTHTHHHRPSRTTAAAAFLIVRTYRCFICAIACVCGYCSGVHCARKYSAQSQVQAFLQKHGASALRNPRLHPITIAPPVFIIPNRLLPPTHPFTPHTHPHLRMHLVVRFRIAFGGAKTHSFVHVVQTRPHLQYPQRAPQFCIFVIWHELFGTIYKNSSFEHFQVHKWSFFKENANQLGPKNTHTTSGTSFFSLFSTLLTSGTIFGTTYFFPFLGHFFTIFDNFLPSLAIFGQFGPFWLKNLENLHNSTNKRSNHFFPPKTPLPSGFGQFRGRFGPFPKTRVLSTFRCQNGHFSKENTTNSAQKSLTEPQEHRF